MQIKRNDTIGLIVARNIHAASVFNAYGIDYYTRGDRSLESACSEDSVAMSNVMEELYELQHGSAPDFTSMDLTDLTMYIFKTHHQYTERKLVFIHHTLDRLVKEQHDERSKLVWIKKRFEILSAFLINHMKQEEFFVFPFIQRMAKAKRENNAAPATFEPPITSLQDDHRQEVSLLATLSEMTHNYTLPPNSDYGLRIAFAAMRELEEDLKIHMHLENNILFPKAMSLTGATRQNPN